MLGLVGDVVYFMVLVGRVAVCGVALMVCGGRAHAFLDARTAQDLAMAGMTAMALHGMYADDKDMDQPKPRPEFTDSCTQRLERGYLEEKRGARVWHATIVACMLMYSLVNAMCLVWASDAGGGFGSEYYRFLGPLQGLVSEEVQEKVCAMFTVMHAGSALVSALHLSSPHYMCNRGELSAPVQALRVIAVTLPMIGRHVVTEVLGVLGYVFINASCGSVYGSAREARDADRLIAELAVQDAPQELSIAQKLRNVWNNLW